MEVTLVHPDNEDTKMVASHPIQVAALKDRGFVEESELAASKVEAAKPEGPQDESEELARLKAENKALKSENKKLKNKLNQVVPADKEVPEGDEPEVTDPENDGSASYKESK